MMKSIIRNIAIVICLGLLMNCASTYQYKVEYPAAEDIFITLGDDPGTESEVPYIPKGYYYYSHSEYYMPIPILGLIIFGNADIDHIMYDKVIPDIRKMGGNSLTNGSISHIKRPSTLSRFFGFGSLTPATTTVFGQVNSK